MNMFTRRKRNYRTFIFSAVIVTLCLLIVAIAWPTEPETEDAYGNQSGTKQEEQNGTTHQDGVDLSENGQPVSGQTGSDGSGKDGDEETNMSQDGQSYYLVKRAGDQIVVYFCDEAGQTVQLETTEILYELLGPDDQKLFDEGVKVSSQEELGTLLQDFEG